MIDGGYFHPRCDQVVATCAQRGGSGGCSWGAQLNSAASEARTFSGSAGRGSVAVPRAGRVISFPMVNNLGFRTLTIHVLDFLRVCPQLWYQVQTKWPWRCQQWHHNQRNLHPHSVSRAIGVINKNLGVRGRTAIVGTHATAALENGPGVYIALAYRKVDLVYIAWRTNPSAETRLVRAACRQCLHSQKISRKIP